MSAYWATYGAYWASIAGVCFGGVVVVALVIAALAADTWADRISEWWRNR